MRGCVLCVVIVDDDGGGGGGGVELGFRNARKMRHYYCDMMRFCLFEKIQFDLRADDSLDIESLFLERAIT